MHTEGWRRLWELTKWVAAFAAAIWCVMSFTAAIPPPTVGSSPEASQIVAGIFLVAVIGGGLAYGALHALEWVYRGFRPLPTDPTVEAPPLALDTPEPAQPPLPEQRPALPHPDNQQS